MDIGSNSHTSYCTRLHRLFSEFIESAYCIGGWVWAYPNSLGGGGGIDPSFFVFLKPFIEDLFPTHHFW